MELALTMEPTLLHKECRDCVSASFGVFQLNTAIILLAPL